MKKLKNNIFLFFFFIILLTIISCVIAELSMDSIWNYGFSYSIANGSIPYRDFNMIIGPFYSLLIAPFIKLFGNYIIVFQIINSMFISLIMIPVFHKIKWKSLYLIMFLILQQTIYGYNTFCAFLVILILLLLDSDFKYKNIFIGIIIGCIIMTKHNIGFCLAIVYFFTSKEKIKSILSMLISILPIIIYLLINDALLGYIDFCYLGMGNFLENFYIEIPCLLCLLIILFFLIKQYLNTKDIKILYLIAFLFLNFPLIENSHFLFGLIPAIYYIIYLNKNNYFNVIIKLTIFLISIVILISRIFTFHYSNIEYFKFNRVPKKNDVYINGIIKYIKLNEKDYDVYLFNTRAYLIKINLNKKISFTDLINKGNLGSNESKYYIEVKNKCYKIRCLFILDSEFFDSNTDIKSQINPIFKNFVLENYNYLETLPSGDRVYTNDNPEN